MRITRDVKPHEHPVCGSVGGTQDARLNNFMNDIIAKINKRYERKNVAQVRTGDRVRVHQKIREGKKDRIQIFEGMVIKVAGGRGINGSFTVRRIASGVGVEKSFPFHLPSIVKVEKIKSAHVRQSRIYYVRGLVGKSAKRMKGEKDAKGVWEDVVEEKPESKEEKVEKSEAEDKTQNEKVKIEAEKKKE